MDLHPTQEGEDGVGSGRDESLGWYTAVARKVFRQNRTRRGREALWVMTVHGP